MDEKRVSGWCKLNIHEDELALELGTVPFSALRKNKLSGKTLMWVVPREMSLVPWPKKGYEMKGFFYAENERED